MKMVVTSVRDVVAERFLDLHTEQSDATAQRNFQYSVREATATSNGLVASNPGDFWLFAVGEFDTETGELVSCPPRCLLRGDSID